MNTITILAVFWLLLIHLAPSLVSYHGHYCFAFLQSRYNKVHHLSPIFASVGIDLGTTFSLISFVNNNTSKIIPIDGRRSLPSVVAFKENHDILVGEEAKRQQIANPLNTFSSVKRLIGRSSKEALGSDRNSLISRIDREDSKNQQECRLICPLLQKSVSPSEISSYIVKKLLEEAQLHIGDEDIIDKAVVTVPAYFNKQQRQATESVVTSLGLQKVKLLREPEAAALAYGLLQEERKIILVFDLGGGTFDVSVLEIGDGFVEVIATSGDAHLGGDDFDEVIVEWVLSQVKSQEGSDIESAIRSNSTAIEYLKKTAIQIKLALSTKPSESVSLQLPNETTLNVILTRGKFESICKPLLKR